MSLRVEEVDENDLDGDPATVNGQILPGDGFQSDWVYVCREEPSTAPEELLDGDTASSFGEGKELNQIS